jgi:hypothetical protein
LTRFARPRLSLRHLIGAALVLGSIDLVLIGLFIGHALSVKNGWSSPLRDEVFNFNQDGGLAEWFEYGKSTIAALALIACARLRAAWAFLVLSGLHVWIAADNSLRLHERLGARIGDAVIGGDVMGVISAAAAGQVVFHGLVFVTASALMALAIIGAPRTLWPTLGLLFVAAISPGLFGVGVDAFHASKLSSGVGRGLITLVEDGGETVMLSAACALAIACSFALRDSRPDHAVHA